MTWRKHKREFICLSISKGFIYPTPSLFRDWPRISFRCGYDMSNGYTRNYRLEATRKRENLRGYKGHIT
jgi:hypothetical protein